MDGPITAELGRSQCVQNWFFGPLYLVKVSLVNLCHKSMNYLFLRLDIGLEIMRNEIPVVVVEDCSHQSHQQVLLSEHTTSNSLDCLLQLGRYILLWTHGWHLLLQVIYLLNSCSKNEDVFLAHFFIDFDIGAIHSPNDEPSIHNKLHITGSRCLGACGRDVLA